MNKKIVSKEIIEKVADLAKLTLRTGEVEKFEGQLSKVFEYAGLISKLNTSYIGETSQMVYKPNRFRDDVINTELMFSQENAVSQAKRSHKGFFVVTAIL